LPFYATAQTQPGEPQPTITPDAKGQTDKTAAAKKVDPELIIELGASYEFLSKGKPDWQTYYLFFNRKFSSGQTLYGSASAVRRFNVTDANLMVGFVQPFTESKSWIATFEAAGSPNHQVLPTVSIFAQLERIFGKGWLGHAGMRHTRYSTDTVNMGVFGVERYFKAYRGSYNLFVAHQNGNGTAASHVFRGDYYYGERNSVGLGFAFGQEIESVGGGQVLRTDVLDFSLIGRHWIDKKWGLLYVGVWHRQGTLYTRSGAQIGVLRRF
jgi:YaiO family outer membrane protein